MGRKTIYTNDACGKQARRQYKTNYMLNKEWRCPICGQHRDYSLAGKWSHLKTKKHIKNAEALDKTQ